MHSPNLHTVILTALSICVAALGIAQASENLPSTLAEAKLASVEGRSGARLGVYALNTEDGSEIRHRADERFPLCSTFKVILVSAILERSMHDANLLQQPESLLTHSACRFPI